MADYEALMNKVGAKDFEEGMATVRRWVTFALTHGPSVLEMHASRERMVEFVAQIPDDYVPAIDNILRGVPELIRTGIGQLHKGVAKYLPPPPGGRPAVPAQERHAICRFVLKTYGDGVPIGTAHARAAKKFGLGLRTVERIWRDRANLPALSIDVREIIRALKEETIAASPLGFRNDGDE